MRVVIFGASGMVGQGALQECLRDPDVRRVVSVVRAATGKQHEKLHEIVHQNFLDFTAIEHELTGLGRLPFLSRRELGRNIRGRLHTNHLRIHDCRGADTSQAQSWDVLCTRFRLRRRQQRAWTRTVGSRERQNRERAARHALSLGVHVSTWHHSATQWN